jgi:hypothetical protein
MASTGTRGDGRTKPEWGKPEDPRPTPKARPTAKPTVKHAGKAASAAKAKVKAKTRTKAAPKARAKASPKARSRRPRRTGSDRVRRLRKRYGVVYDTSGPRVRLGVCWFAVAFVAILVGPVATSVVYGLAAALAAAQMARAWRKKAPKPSDVMAAGGAALIVGGACFGAGGAGLGMLGAVAAAFVAASGDHVSRNPRIADIGWTLQCALAPGIVGMSMVLLARLDQGSAIALLLLVSVYETGDYLVGSGASNPFEGPAAGVAAIVVVTFIVSTLPISALSFGQAWLFGGLVAVLAPAGQLLGSGLLPTATSPASALRRLDSLLLTAPVWAWGVGLALT